MIQNITITSNNNTLQGAFHEGNKDVPVVIVHGYFSSNKNGPYRLYYQIAEKLNQLNYSVLRVDFSGMGESSGMSEDIQFVDHVHDLEESVKYVLKRTNSNKVHLIAHCIGCATALQFSKENKGIIQSITLLAPFVPTDNNYLKMLGPDKYAKTMSSRLFWHKCMHCDSSFITAGKLVEDISILNQLCGKVKVFLPDMDEFSDFIDGIAWVKRVNARYEIICDSDHNFCTPNGRKQILDRLNDYFQSL